MFVDWAACSAVWPSWAEPAVVVEAGFSALRAAGAGSGPQLEVLTFYSVIVQY